MAGRPKNEMAERLETLDTIKCELERLSERTGASMYLISVVAHMEAHTPTDGKGVPLSANRRTNIAKAIREGWTWDKITKHFHCSMATVKQVKEWIEKVGE